MGQRREQPVNHCLVKTAERIRSGRLGLVRWLTGSRGEEQPIGAPFPMFNSFERSIRAGRMCIAVESPELAADHMGATWEIVCPKTVNPPNSTACAVTSVVVEESKGAA